jgi:Adenosine deaminase
LLRYPLFAPSAPGRSGFGVCRPLPRPLGPGLASARPRGSCDAEPRALDSPGAGGLAPLLGVRRAGGGVPRLLRRLRALALLRELRSLADGAGHADGVAGQVPGMRRRVGGLPRRGPLAVPAGAPGPGADRVPAEAIAALPKVELHVHLEGSIRPSTVLALAERNGIDSLHAVRIGHGVRALEDRSLVQRLIDEQVSLEVSPTSNVLLGVTAPSIADHPIGEMIGLGMDVSVNTDDPGYFSTTLERELALVAEHHGVDAGGLAALQRRAMSASFAPAEVRASFGAELGAWESTWSRP